MFTGKSLLHRRLIAIGDGHGCSAALDVLIRVVEPGPEDTIVTLGDSIDRGPDSRGVIEQLLALGERCNLIPLMGNHEEMLLGAMESRSGLTFWMQFGGQEMLDSYGGQGGWEIIPRQHVEFLRNCRKYHESASHIFVHANYWPNRRMEDQPTSALFWEILEPERAAPHCQNAQTAVPQPGDGSCGGRGTFARSIAWQGVKTRPRGSRGARARLGRYGRKWG